MKRVEYKDTISIEFYTKVYSSSTGKITDVVPSSYSAYLETAEVTPVQLAELTNIEQINTSTYLVRFYADTSTYEDIKSGEPYYVSFYWEFNAVKKCERIGVVVVPDV